LIDLPADIPPPPQLQSSSRRRHELLVVLALAAVSAGVLFADLGTGRMEPDESLYALATDQLRAGGDWLTLSPHPPAPYFNKPPLYVWLSALTYDRVPGFELKYRFWSAVFGVAAVAATGALGTRLFRPMVGLIAGLLLLTNRSFLLDHGARFGGMDAALAACAVAVLWLYWAGRTTARGVWPWACIGVVAGVASLLKPLAGVPLLAVIGLHAVVTRRTVLGGAVATDADVPAAATAADGGRSPPYKVPAIHFGLAAGVVLVVAVAVAGPWYGINHYRFPDTFARQLFGQQIADSVVAASADDEARPWHFYWLKVPASSTLWALVVPAAAWLAVAAVRDVRRRAVLLLLLVAGLGWVAGFSVPRKKFLHYAYPAFPALAVMMAACLADVLGHVARRARDGGWLRSTNGSCRAGCGRPWPGCWRSPGTSPSSRCRGSVAAADVGCVQSVRAGDPGRAGGPAVVGRAAQAGRLAGRASDPAEPHDLPVAHGRRAGRQGRGRRGRPARGRAAGPARAVPRPGPYFAAGVAPGQSPARRAVHRRAAAVLGARGRHGGAARPGAAAG
jgi:hypothetical protein